ncbi:hypothetical protein M422DRAFT_252901 [Sphaerobolus stellatus SS14]|uniref:HTH CENPB-type domain-containing protein n=1 Tax=Sphaerobolus stellatus (strain SS14) TaxID=990650 RepID=A0A0C9VXM5_SPHS4|nr:hypothetical protein M422DRAFT_252901 [Sphaerobolus stellatus SS14]
MRQHIYNVTGRAVSAKWVQRFLKRHPEISAKRPRPLDPKCARAFNPTTVNHHFNLLSDVITRYKIPVENIYNTDERGLQLGGGRKASTIQPVFAATDRNNYILKSDTLLLITIIETICADGTACPPGIIMPPGATSDWHEVDDIGCFTQSTNG